MFYAPAPPQPIQQLQPTGPSPEQLREKFLVGLRPLLSSFTGGQAIKHLTGHIEKYGILKVDVPTRLEILSKIRDNAGNHYFRNWAENKLAMQITKQWLVDSVGAAPDSPGATVTMPLLHVSGCRVTQATECSLSIWHRRSLIACP